MPNIPARSNYFGTSKGKEAEAAPTSAATLLSRHPAASSLLAQYPPPLQQAATAPAPSVASLLGRAPPPHRSILLQAPAAAAAAAPQVFVLHNPTTTEQQPYLYALPPGTAVAAARMEAAYPPSYLTSATPYTTSYLLRSSAAAQSALDRARLRGGAYPGLSDLQALVAGSYHASASLYPPPLPRHYPTAVVNPPPHFPTAARELDASSSSSHVSAAVRSARPMASTNNDPRAIPHASLLAMEKKEEAKHRSPTKAAKKVAAKAKKPHDRKHRRGIKYKNDSFPMKLHRLLLQLESTQQTHIARFSADGKRFLIHDRTKLEKDVLPQFFRHGNFKSFKRLLYMYGFERTSGGQGVEETYWHADFNRDAPDKCQDMLRKNSTAEQMRQQQERSQEEKSDSEDASERS